MTLRGTNQESGRPYNRRIVLESIRLNGPTTRGDIAARVGLTVQTVSTIVRELEEQELVLSVREKPRGRGIPPSALTINPEGGYALGIHLTPLGKMFRRNVATCFDAYLARPTTGRVTYSRTV